VTGAALTPAQADRLDRLFRLHHPAVLRVARAHTMRPADADDVAAETWARAARSLPLLRADDNGAGRWLARIARFAAADMYRPKRASERPMDWADSISSRTLPTAGSAEDDALAVMAVRARIERAA
jgi:DNA-directed RNA polymerase specialized sigma24 family protein